MSLAKHLDQIQAHMPEANTLYVKAQAQYWLGILDQVIQPDRYEEYYTMAICLPIIIRDLGIIPGSFAYDVSELVYYGPSRANIPSALPFEFDGNHLVLSATNARLWVFPATRIGDSMKPRDCSVVYKKHGEQNLYNFSGHSDLGTIDVRHMNFFFDEFIQKMNDTKEWIEKL